jgi:putative copper resistance protein D
MLLLITTSVALALALTAWQERTPSPVEIPVVEIVLPVTRSLSNLASGALLGSLIIAAVVLPDTSPLHAKAMDIAASAAALWAALTLVGAVLAYFSLAGPVSWDIMLQSFGQFLGEVGLGQAYLVTALFASIIAVLSFMARKPAFIAVLVVSSLATLVPLALQGHAAGAGSHSAASSAVWIHAAAAGAWIGGLGVTALLLSQKPPGAETIVKRFSSIALVCFVVLSMSGVISATFRLTDVSDLWSTTYGQLVVAKTITLVMLGIAGAAHRKYLIVRFSRSLSARANVFRLIVAELALMGVASGTAAALSRTATPIQEPLAVTPSQRLIGQQLPPPLDFEGFVSSWTIEPVWAIGVIGATILYGSALYHRRARERRDLWPMRKTAAWMTGLAVLAYATNGAPAVYGTYLLSQQTLMHVLVLIASALLVAGDPVGLAVQVLPSRRDGSRGRREWLQAMQASRIAAVLTNPRAATPLLIGSSWLFFSPTILQWSLDDPLGRQWMIGHLLIVGLLFSASVQRPATSRRPALIVLVAVCTASVTYLLLGAVLVNAPDVILPSWYGVITEGWIVSPLSDQRLAGAVMFTFSLIVALCLAPVATRALRSTPRRDTARDVDAHDS